MSSQEAIKNKSAKILVIDVSDSSRLTVSTGLREAGFTDVVGVGDVTSAMELIDQEPIDWVITSLYGDDSMPAKDLIKKCLREERYSHLTVSVLVLENEKEQIPDCFEQGVLSWHLREYVQGHFEAEFKDLNAVIEENEGDFTLAAGHYLRKYLREAKNVFYLQKLEQELAQMYPSKPQQHLFLAESEFLSENVEGATERLKKVLTCFPDKEADIKSLASNYGVEIGERLPHEVGKLFGIELVLVVEQNAESSKVIQDTLQGMGCNVFELSNFAEADASLQASLAPDLVIMGWDNDNVECPVFIQKVLANPELETDFVVITDPDMNWEDKALLSELGVKSIVNRPLSEEALLADLMRVGSSSNFPKTGEALELSVRHLVKHKKLEEAEKLVVGIENNPHVSKGQRLLIQGQIYFGQKKFRLAADALIAGVENGADSLFAMNFLGKCMMKLSNHDAALRCFHKAQEWSPKSIERLSNISVTHCANGDQEKAKEALDAVSQIDADNPNVLEAKAAVSLAEGDTTGARAALTKLKNHSGVLAMLNNQGVALTKAKKFEEGIKLYQDALAAIPDNSHTAKTQINYNLALAYAREGKDLEKALEVATAVQSMKSVNPTIKAKSRSLAQRLKAAVENGEAFELKTGGKAEADNDKEVELVFESGVFQFGKGERCLYRVFVKLAHGVKKAS